MTAPVTPAFEAELRRSHRAIARVDLLTADGQAVERSLPVIAGAVEVDRAAPIRRRCMITVLGEGLVPEDLEVGFASLSDYGASGERFGDPGDVWAAFQETAISPDGLTPYGREVVVYRGVRYPDDTTELVSLGRFLVDVSAISETGEGIVVELEGVDLAQRVRDNRWVDPYVIARGTNYSAAIEALITDRYPDAVTDFAAYPAVTPLVVLGEERDNDPWDDARDLARNIGHRLAVNASGTFVLEPDVAGDDPAWEFRGGDQGTVIGATRHLSRERVYNVAVVTGESPDLEAPVRAVAEDLNPKSPTRVSGPFGRKPYFYTSAYITDAGQAQTTANALLRQIIGQDEEIQIETVPVPHLDADDLIRVVRAPLKVAATYTIERLSIPLGPEEPMRVTARRLRADTPEEED